MRKKIFLSAIALSLVLPTLRSFAQSPLEEENPQDLQTSLSKPLAGQSYSLIPWESLDPVDWLSFQNWRVERKVKDKTPLWEVRLREARYHELMGKVLKCSGSCQLHRGSKKTKIQHLSQIREGDEVVTEKNSVAWIFLMDGSLMRLSPSTSISFQEINISDEKILLLARLNSGHVFFHTRTKNDLVVNEHPETDAISLPLLVKEANQEYFERTIYQSQNDKSRLKEVMNLFDKSIALQYEALNSLKQKNNSHYFHNTHMILISPNVTVESQGQSFDHLHFPGGKSFIKMRPQTKGELSLHLRGYVKSDPLLIQDHNWREISINGKSAQSLEESKVPATFGILELLTKRIKTIELAREIWMEKFSIPILKNINSQSKMSQKFGYRVWGNEIEKRIEFVKEYTRRIETTNLQSIQRLKDRGDLIGEDAQKDFSKDIYQASLESYLLGLKSRFGTDRIHLSDLNDLKYYIWLLKNGKL